MPSDGGATDSASGSEVEAELNDSARVESRSRRDIIELDRQWIGRSWFPRSCHILIK